MKEDELLETLHSMIDNKFNRKKREKITDMVRLKNSVTLHAICLRLFDYDPESIADTMMRLVKRGSVATNMYDDNIHPFDSYFIPISEL